MISLQDIGEKCILKNEGNDDSFCLKQTMT